MRHLESMHHISHVSIGTCGLRLWYSARSDTRAMNFWWGSCCGKGFGANSVSTSLSFESRRTSVRVVLWQYWFTTMAEKRVSGMWWQRQWVGLYGPTLERDSHGDIKVVEWPTVQP